MRIHEIEDIYKVLGVHVLFDNPDDYNEFEFNIFFDIQKTLEDKFIVNVLNSNIIDGEVSYLLLRSYDIMDMLPILEAMIDEKRYIGTITLDYRKFDKKCGCDVDFYDSMSETCALNGAQIAQLRTLRDKLLEILSYGN